MGPGRVLRPDLFRKRNEGKKNKSFFLCFASSSSSFIFLKDPEKISFNFVYLEGTGSYFQDVMEEVIETGCSIFGI